MAYEKLTDPGLDYQPCRYEPSRLWFRGPKKLLDQDYISFVGGTKTYGKFVRRPFPDLLEDDLGMTTVNLACINAGIEAVDLDPSIKFLCQRSRITVLQVMGAHNLSNRLYMVHPRRNDRFVKASKRLRSIYPDVDFTHFNFTRHLLRTLKDASPEKFKVVEAELKRAWVARMKGLIRQIGGKIVLLWLAERSPEDQEDIDAPGDPALVDAEMLANVSRMVDEMVAVRVSGAEGSGGLPEMVYSDVEAPMAALLPGPLEHRRIADALAPCLVSYLAEE
jgi:hypothetical protein